MTDPVITWKLDVDKQEEMIVDGQTFENVVTVVHWQVFATDPDTGTKVRDYSAKTVAAPTSQADYIDLSTLQGMDEDTVRQTVIGWAEAVEPGFLAEKEAKVKDMLTAALVAPKTASVAIL